MTFILPQWAYSLYSSDEKKNICSEIVKALLKQSRNFKLYFNQLKSAEKAYFTLMETTDETGLRAEQARGVLGLDLKTVFIQCGFEDDWQHFFDLRVEKGAHPDAQYIAGRAKIILNL